MRNFLIILTLLVAFVLEGIGLFYWSDTTFAMFNVYCISLFICIFVFWKFFKKDIFHPIALYSLLLLLILYSRAFMMLFFNVSSNYFYYSNEQYLLMYVFQVIVLSLCSLGSFAIGYAFSNVFFRETSKINLLIYNKVNYVIVLLLFFIGVISFYIYYSKLGGIVWLLSNFSASKNVSGGGVFFLIGSLIIGSSCLAIISTAKNPRLFSLTLLLSSLIILGIYGRTGPLVWLIFIYFLLYSKIYRLPNQGKLAIIFLMGVSILYVVKAVRTMLAFDITLDTIDIVFQFLMNDYQNIGGDLANLDVSMSVLKDMGHRYEIGDFMFSWVAWLYQLIPGYFWAEKEQYENIGRIMYQIYRGGYGDSGLTIFGFVTAYVSGWWFLVILLYILFGLIIGILYNKSKMSNNIWYLFLYGTGIYSFLMFNRTGDLSAVMIQMIVLSGGLFFALATIMLVKLSVNHR